MSIFSRANATFLTTAATVWLSLAQTASSADSNVMFILDASNSMWGQIDGRAKIDIAKDVLTDMVSNLPQGSNAGLIAYGHQHDHKQKNCRDMALLTGYQPTGSGIFSRQLDAIAPRGQTPIAATLERSADWVTSGGVQNPTVVLITDGIESCDGDPCAAATSLASAGIGTTIHVVGYDLKERQRAAVKCISDNGNGKYFDARNADGLKSALEEVKIELAQAEKPQPVKPSAELYFEDEFDGQGLSDDWSVINQDEDAYIVEDGELLLVASTVQGLWVKDASNIIQLSKNLPSGDWDIHVDLKLDMQTGKDSFELGLFSDDQNYLAANLIHDRGDWCHMVQISLFKRSRGKDTGASKYLSSNSGHCGEKVHGDVPDVVRSIAEHGLRISLSKRSREYSATAILKGIVKDGKPRSVQTPSLTSLRSPGLPALAIGTHKKANGELVGYIDRIEIVSLQ